jgi:hypothetical protein
MLKFEIKTITPEEAKRILSISGNCNIRRMSAPHVEHLARQMQRGSWRENGETIKFNDAGLLVDGQHRLAAIVRSGVTLDLAFVYGATSEGVDEGRKRSFADLLSNQVDGFSREIAPVVKYVALIKAGRDPFDARHALTNQDLQREYDAMRKDLLLECARIGRQVANRFTGSMVATVCYLADYRLPPDQWSRPSSFFARSHAGIGLSAGSPEHALLTWAADNHGSRAGHNGNAVIRGRLIAYIKAWNAYSSGMSLTVAKMTNRIFARSDEKLIIPAVNPGGRRVLAEPESHRTDGQRTE